MLVSSNNFGVIIDLTVHKTEVQKAGVLGIIIFENFKFLEGCCFYDFNIERFSSKKLDSHKKNLLIMEKLIVGRPPLNLDLIASFPAPYNHMEVLLEYFLLAFICSLGSEFLSYYFVNNVLLATSSVKTFSCLHSYGHFVLLILRLHIRY